MPKADKLLEQAQSHLNEGESVLASVMGSYETKRMGEGTVRSGILIATDQRLVFYAKKVGGYEFESFPYENISSFEQGKDMMMGHKLAFHASGNNVKVKWINDVSALASLVEVTRGRMGKQATATAPVSSQSDGEPAARLKKLAELKDAGLISGEEFETQRARILSDI
jgi:Bacterial PH domain/Short C-terminal domain